MLVSTESGVVIDEGIGVVIFIFGGGVCAWVMVKHSPPESTAMARYAVRLIPFLPPTSMHQLTSLAPRRSAAKSCRTTVPVVRRDVAACSSPSRERSGPSFSHDLRGLPDRNRHIPTRQRFFVDPLFDCRDWGIAHRFGAWSGSGCHRPQWTRRFLLAGWLGY